MADLKKVARNLLAKANIKINGNRPWDIKVNDERLYKRVLRGGSLALGESYMDGWWDCEKLDEFFFRIIRSELASRASIGLKTALSLAGQFLFNAQRKTKAFEVGEEHYDLGNDLYQAMLDQRLTYTCGYWKNADNLDDAQEAKLDLVCQKIGLRKGQSVLDIGSGWGSFIKFAAEKYGAKTTGITVSKEQAQFSKKISAGLPVKIKLQDYRDVGGMYDHVISLGMFEHVGEKNYRTYMQVVHNHLKENGLFLLHTIGTNVSVKVGDPWLIKYIFPNAMLPSVAQIAKAVDGLFVMEDWHSFGQYYDQTLLAWFKNFDSHWGKLKKNYSERFYRMWKYYLLMSAGTFRARRIQLWQIVFSKNGVVGGYNSIR